MNIKSAPCAPARAFLDWPVVTDPERWNTDVALLGIQHSEPYGAVEGAVPRCQR